MFVISQSIDPGTEVSRGTSVSYVVSRGPETKIVNVPDIMGMDEATASQTLSQYGLVGQYAGESYSDDYGAGQSLQDLSNKGNQGIGRHCSTVLDQCGIREHHRAGYAGQRNGDGRKCGILTAE